MKKHSLIAILLLAILMASALPGSAQGVVSLTIDDLVLDEFPNARALVTVRDENGVPIVGLGPDKFEMVEDGRASFPPVEVTAQVNPDAIVSIVMVIDISGSMKGKPIEEAMRAANALIDQLSQADRAAIIAFADEVQNLDPTVLEDGKEIAFTTDKNALRNVINFLDTKIGWDTPLYDAIYKGVKMVSSEPVGKRAVIVMTDGRDERDNAQGVAVKDAGSLSSPDDPINEANRHNIPIFSVGLVGLGGKIDEKYLQRLAERTGGGYQKAPQPEELTPLFENVVNQLKQQYVLAYDSGLPDDSNYHSLLVRVQLPKGQAFDETKFQISTPVPPPPTSAPEPGETQPPVPTSVPETSPVPGTPPPSPVPTPTPKSGLGTIVDTLREKPLLAVVIGAGVLLLLALLVALVIVLLRGKGPEEEEWAGEVTDYGTPGGWTPGPAGSGTPIMTPLSDDKTAAAPDSWPEVTPGPTAPAPGGLATGPTGPGVPAAGQTRIIERAPQHLAVLVDKSRPDRKFDLKGMTNIGRGRDNQIVLDDPTVSRNHAWIKAEGDDYLVFDVGSANGTFVNDQRVDEPRRLENRDVVRFGEAKFIFTQVF
jgi:VWFA-related protein